MKNIKSAVIDTTVKDFMYYWLKFIKPFHTLAEQPMRILSLFLYYHYIYKDTINDEKALWKIVFDYDTKLKITEELNIKNYTLQNTLTTLRNKGFIKNNMIDNRFIPNLEKNSNHFKINFIFNIKNNE